jgi:hypothetical protein
MLSPSQPACPLEAPGQHKVVPSEHNGHRSLLILKLPDILHQPFCSPTIHSSAP